MTSAIIKVRPGLLYLMVIVVSVMGINGTARAASCAMSGPSSGRTRSRCVSTSRWMAPP
jgi:hypothetical protein